MSIQRKKIIENFCKRFLNVGYTPKSFTDILNLEPGSLKGCSESKSRKLEKIKIKKIRDLAKIKINDISALAEEIKIEEIDLKKWVLAAQLVSRAWKKRSHYLKKNEMKVAVLGLDNAGKTTMLESMSERTLLGDVVNIEPTIGVEVRSLSSENFNMSVWDFGGQIGHRNEYLQAPEEYFLQIDLMIYVIDMQDEDRFEESIDYFKEIISILKYLNENPFFLIFLHKSDPDISQDPEFVINLEYVRGEFFKIFQEFDCNFYEMTETSIYNLYATQPKFAKTFKSFFANKEEKKSIETYLEELSKALQALSVSILDQFKILRELILAQPNSEHIKTANSKKMAKQFLDREFKRSLQECLIPPPPPPEKPVALAATEYTESSSNANKRILLNELKDVLKTRHLMND